MSNKSALRRAIRDVLRLCVLPPHVAIFQWRARRLAHELGDEFALGSSTRPADLRRLLKLAGRRRQIVEVGTANGWTAIALALADRRRHVVTFDPVDRPERARYLTLIPDSVGSRITFIAQPGDAGPAAVGHNQLTAGVELLYIDSSHERAATVSEVQAWQGVLAEGALIVFDDYGHPDYPGVHEAVQELGLHGRSHGTLYVVTAGVASPHT